MEPRELDSLADSLPVFPQYKINVTLLFHLHASNMLCFLVNKYARNSNLADSVLFFVFFKQGPPLFYKQTFKKLILRTARAGGPLHLVGRARFLELESGAWTDVRIFQCRLVCLRKSSWTQQDVWFSTHCSSCLTCHRTVLRKPG